MLCAFMCFRCSRGSCRAVQRKDIPEGICRLARLPAPRSFARDATPARSVGRTTALLAAASIATSAASKPQCRAREPRRPRPPHGQSPQQNPPRMPSDVAPCPEDARRHPLCHDFGCRTATQASWVGAMACLRPDPHHTQGRVRLRIRKATRPPRPTEPRGAGPDHERQANLGPPSPRFSPRRARTSAQRRANPDVTSPRPHESPRATRRPAWSPCRRASGTARGLSPAAASEARGFPAGARWPPAR
jgi:hypothetical protein